MREQLREVVTSAKAIVADVDASSRHALDAVKSLDQFNALERVAVAGRALVADRAADAAEWTRGGYRSAEEWLAATSGTTYGAAASTLETSAKLKDLPQLDEALRNGELSGPKLAEVGPAATPENESRL